MRAWRVECDVAESVIGIQLNITNISILTSTREDVDYIATRRREMRYMRRGCDAGVSIWIQKSREKREATKLAEVTM